MTQDKSPVDQALELFVFGPVGLALTVREAMPSIVDRGRQQVTGQAMMAKMIGEFAVRQGQKEAAKAFDGAFQQALTLIEQFAGDGTAGAPDRGAADVDHVAGNGSTPSTTRPVATPVPVRTTPVSPSPAPGPSSGPAAAELAIPDYDSLAASQVVPRLTGLSAEELEQVRDYEAAHRGRKTILNRIAQLQSDR